MNTHDSVKTHFSGTHRIREPEETWALVAPLRQNFGVTRLADVTGLDILGIPVWMAVRPLGQTVSVSQGKGATHLHAMVSAVMEAIELWHAECVPPLIAHRSAAAAGLDLPYDVRSVTQRPGSLLTNQTRLDWTIGRGLAGGADIAVPVDTVSLASDVDRGWRPCGILRSSNGLASGNSLAEAALHALYEVIERDALAGDRAMSPGIPVDPGSVSDAGCAELVDRIRRAGAYLEARLMPSRFGVPCFSCRIWSGDFPVFADGSGAHSSAAVALSRAITEAAQSRAGTIAGSRDDLAPVYHLMQAGVVAEPRPPQGQVRWPDLELPAAPVFDVIDHELAWLSCAVAARTGAEPILVDLSTRPEFAVARVVAPGLRFRD
jgi:ribosomal protein S12 methylthiotransferase accessory factor